MAALLSIVTTPANILYALYFVNMLETLYAISPQNTLTFALQSGLQYLYTRLDISGAMHITYTVQRSSYVNLICCFESSACERGEIQL